MECHNTNEVELGHMVSIKNRSKHHLAQHTYKSVWVMDENGEVDILVFSKGELKSARARAEKNPEDVPSLKKPVKKKGALQSLWDFITFK